MHVVVVGGGFAGTELLRGLSASLYRPELTLVDARAEHVYAPLLHERLSDRLSMGALVRPFSRWAKDKLHFVQGVADEVDGQTLRLTDGRAMPFDALVLATGSRNRLEGPRRDGSILHLPAHKFADDAPAIEHAIKAGPRRITVVGDGLTGVEHAAELAFRGGVEVRLAGRSGLPLHGYPEALRQNARTGLLQVRVKLIDEVIAAPVEAPGAGHFDELYLWAAGMVAAGVPRGVPTTAAGFIPVDRWLRVKGPVFALGDIAKLFDAGGSLIPTTMRAAEAIFQGSWLAGALPKLLEGETPAPYVAKPDFDFYGVSLGPKSLVTYRGHGPNTRAGVLFRRGLMQAYWARSTLL